MSRHLTTRLLNNNNRSIRRHYSVHRREDASPFWLDVVLKISGYGAALGGFLGAGNGILYAADEPLPPGEKTVRIFAGAILEGMCGVILGGTALLWGPVYGVVRLCDDDPFGRR